MMADALRAEIHRRPRALGPRFVFVREGISRGEEGLFEEALAVARETVERPRHQWSLPASEGVNPPDLDTPLFHARRYLALLEEEARGRKTEGERVDVILASIHHHLSLYEQDPEDARAAVALDPAFPWYRIRLVELLVLAGLLDEAAGHIPAILACHRGATAPPEAYEVIVLAHAAGLVSDREMETAHAEHRAHRRHIMELVPLEPLGDLDGRRVAIFGASTTGRSCLDDLRGRGIEVAFFLDNVRAGCIDGIPILRPVDAMGGPLDAVDAVVLASAGDRFRTLMRAQLRDLGVRLPVFVYPCSSRSSRRS